MYLSVSKYVGDWDHSKQPERDAYKAIVEAVDMPSFRCDHSPHLTVDLCVAYWRKANAIHKWFVDNCQEGRDECQRAYVPREKLQELVELCKRALASKDGSALPPQSGFFFGSTAIDSGYWQDVQLTIDQIERLLKNPKLADCSFYYESSW